MLAACSSSLPAAPPPSRVSLSYQQPRSFFKTSSTARPWVMPSPSPSGPRNVRLVCARSRPKSLCVLAASLRADGTGCWNECTTHVANQAISRNQGAANLVPERGSHKCITPSAAPAAISKCRTVTWGRDRERICQNDASQSSWINSESSSEQHAQEIHINKRRTTWKLYPV